jgi:hypothetical protein
VDLNYVEFDFSTMEQTQHYDAPQHAMIIKVTCGDLALCEIDLIWYSTRKSPQVTFMIMDCMLQTTALGAIVARMDVLLTTTAKTKASMMTKMEAMTKILPGTCQGRSTGQGLRSLLVWCLAGFCFSWFGDLVLVGWCERSLPARGWLISWLVVSTNKA